MESKTDALLTPILPPGWVLLKHKRARGGVGLVVGQIVLARCDHDDGYGPEWVTWFYAEPTRACSSGNYYHDYGEAMRDFAGRS